MSSQLDTYNAEVLGVILSVNAFECWHARGPSRLARLVKDLTCAAASQAYVNASFLPVGTLFWTTKSYVQVSRDERLHKTQSAGRNVLPTVTVFQRLGVNVAELM